ncbi:MAG: 5'-3'-deoxyribonucleotidase [Acidobacteriaceae bacterium]
MPSSHSPRQTIAVDMDEVIADALGEHLRRYNRDHASAARPAITLDDLRGRRLWQVAPPEHHPLIDNYLRDHDFFRVLRVMPDAQRVLQRLQSRYDIFIASAAMEVPTSFVAKYEWLAEHFPFIPTSHIVFCGDKSILRADFLIDDNPRQLRSFQTTPPATFRTTPTDNTFREGILYTSPANVHITGYRRVDNWQAIEDLFLTNTPTELLQHHQATPTT